MKQKILLLLLSFWFYSVLGQQAYYSGIDFTKSGLDLKSDLTTLITNTHTNILSYGWNATQATDVNPTNTSNVLLIYGYEPGNDTDCTNDLERSVNSNGGSNCDYNREHVYPKSLGTPSFESRSTPGADGHHIRASDVQRNGTRGNQLFADGSGNSSNVTGGWYPGDEWKGDVARIIMYMYLRYGSQCLPSNVGVGSSTETPDEMISLFLQWNAEDPVSDYEDNRNTYHSNLSNTYAQGNRNPFIDNPYLATKIWGGSVAEDRWGTLSNHENILQSVKVYPNPVHQNKVFINTQEELDIEIYNVLGKLVLKTRLSQPKNGLNISSLADGMYLLKLSTHKHTTTQKLIKQ